MNIAFPALLVFLLAMPGIILRASYQEWGWKFPIFRRPLGEEIAQSVFGAAALNLIWCGLAAWAGYRIVFKDLLLLLLGGTGVSPAIFDNRLTVIAQNSQPIAAYFLTLYLGSAVVGFGGRQLVRRFHLDWRFSFLRFGNFWHYALNAELPFFSENRKAYARIASVPVEALSKQEVLVRLSCVVYHGSDAYVYEGTPFDYFFDRAGDLEKIVVRDVTYEKLYNFSPPGHRPGGRAALVPQLRTGRPERRSEMNGGVSPPDPEMPPEARRTDGLFSIESDVFVLTVADAHNLAVKYIFLPEESASSGKSDAPLAD